MNRFFKSLILLLVAFPLIFSSCTTTKEQMEVSTKMVEATFLDVDAKIVAADKYGNLETDIIASDLFKKGYEYGDIVSILVGDNTYKAPIVSTYSDVDVGDFLIRIKGESVYFAINYGNCMKKTGAKEGTNIVVSMSEKGSYLLEYKTRHLTKSQERADYKSDVVFANFREVSLADIAEKTLYRSCNPALADARAPYAEDLAKENKIKTIVNLADSEESLKEHMDSITWYKEMYEKGNVILLDMDVDYSSQEFGSKLAKGFVFISENEAPYLIHCNEGKDRAGFALVVLESLMGASLEEIEYDYMLSYLNYFGVEKGSAQYNYIADTPFNMLSTIAGGIQVKDDHLVQIAENYMLKIGLTKDQILKIKENLK